MKSLKMWYQNWRENSIFQTKEDFTFMLKAFWILGMILIPWLIGAVTIIVLLIKLIF